MRYEFTHIPSGDDLLAAAIDLPRDWPAGGCPTVILCHGLTGNRLGRSYHFVEFARLLARRGIACVRFDQAGCGESTGEFQNLTVRTMACDAAAVRDWAVGQPWCDADRLGWVGVSLGALAAVSAEGERPGRGVSLWAPVFSLERVFSLTAKTGLRAILEGQGWVPYRGLPLGKGFVDHLNAIDTAALLAGSRSPVQLFHSAADEVVPAGESDAYAARCAELGRPCELIRIDTANHDFMDMHHRRELLSKAVMFFQEAMRG